MNRRSPFPIAGFFFLLSLMFLISERSLSAETLTLTSYLKQVDLLNQGFKGNILMMKAMQNKAAEGSVDFSPQLIGNVSYIDNKAPQYGPAYAFYGTENVQEAAGLGVQTKFRTGTVVNLTYNSTFQNIYNSQFAPPFGLYLGAPVLTITQPLWQDFNAALSKANETAIQAGDLMQGLQQLYSAQNVNFNAETSYWRVSLYRQIVQLDKESIDRTQKILERNRKRVAMNVADRADVLQSEAALRAKDLQYQSDLETLREAGMQFNSGRNLRGDVVPEDLQSIDAFIQNDMTKELKQVSERVDVQEAVANAQNQKALAKLAAERVKPTINVYGSVQFNGLSPNINTAYGESFNADNPGYTAGVKILVNLDGGLIHRINEGYQAASEAADVLSQKAKFDLEQDWVDLQKKFKDALLRFDMAKDLEKLQGVKLAHERERFNSGRTTSFQVLTFEDDFSGAQTTRLRIANDLITFRAQARLYNGEAL